MNSAFMVGRKLYFRLLEIFDITDEYMGWLNDREVITGIMNRPFPITTAQQTAYVMSETANPNSVMFAVIERETDKFIGTARLGSISWVHRHGTESCFIGDKTAWGKGYGTELVSLIIKYAFYHLNLDKVYSGVRADHIPSIRKNEKAGYTKIWTEPDAVWADGKWVGKTMFRITRAEFDEHRTPLAWTDGPTMIEPGPEFDG